MPDGVNGRSCCAVFVPKPAAARLPALLKRLSDGDTSAVSAAEKSYAIFSYCVMVIIQGSIAGLMSQLMMSSRVGEQEYIIKLAQLKARCED